MKLVVLDHHRLANTGIDFNSLAKFGEVEVFEKTLPEQLAERVKDVDIIVMNTTILGRKELELCNKAKFISKISTGFDNVDVVAAREMGIVVSNVPTYGPEAIGQHAIALMLELTNRVGFFDNNVRQGKRESEKSWCTWEHPIIELYQKTIGIIGLGRIGQTVARVAAAFRMRVLVYDAVLKNPTADLPYEFVDLDTLLKESDIISLHCPLTDTTKQMINKDTIAKMKDGVMLINNSRGALVVDADLAGALQSGKISAAGLDTVSVEPINMDSPLLQAPNCYITPHISWAAVECRRRLVELTLDNVEAFLKDSPINVVN